MTSFSELAKNPILNQTLKHAGQKEWSWSSGHFVELLCRRQGFDSPRRISGFYSVARLRKAMANQPAVFSPSKPLYLRSDTVLWVSHNERSYAAHYGYIQRGRQRHRYRKTRRRMCRNTYFSEHGHFLGFRSNAVIKVDGVLPRLGLFRSDQLNCPVQQMLTPRSVHVACAGCSRRKGI